MPLRAILRSRFGSKKSARTVATAGDLRSGDLISFKHRLALPSDVQGKTFEVESIAAYEYEDGVYPQLTLAGETGDRLFLLFRDKDPRKLTLARMVPKRDVVRLFGENEFSTLWDEGFADLDRVEKMPEYGGWTALRYSQTRNSAEGYFHDKDCRTVQIGDDEGEEFRAHECEDPSGRFGLCVEVYGDGTTEVTAEVFVDADVIDAMWPGEEAS